MQTEKKQTKETMRMDAKDEIQVDIKTAETVGAAQPDLPRLLEQTLHSFHEVNRGLHRVQQEIAALMQHAVVQQAMQARADGRGFPVPPAGVPGAFPALAALGGQPGSFGGQPGSFGGQPGSFGGVQAARAGNAAVPPAGFPQPTGGLPFQGVPQVGAPGGPAGMGAPFGFPGLLGSAAFGPSAFGRSLRFSRDLKTDPPTTRVPECNVVDQGKEYHVQIEVPGVRKDNLDILCFEQSIVVTAKAESELEDGTLLLNERGPVVYRRTIPLPSEIQTNVSKATLKDGVLTVRLAKRVPTEGPRRLDVAYG